MTATELVVACTGLGITLSKENGELIISDPNGALTPGLRAELNRHAEELAWMVVTSPPVQAPAAEVTPTRPGGRLRKEDRERLAIQHSRRRIAWALLALVLACVAVVLIARFSGVDHPVGDRKLPFEPQGQ